MSAENIKVMLVDDHALVRGALAERLGREAGLFVVGCADDAENALHMAAETRPDVIVMDIDMPGLSCFDAARQISEALPRAALIFLSAFCNDRYIGQALQVRARGYLTKGEPPESLIAAIREVAAGGAYYSPEVQSRIVITGSGVSLASRPVSRASTLTPRELEVLQYLARGLRKKDIAGAMKLSVKTIERHSENLMTKLAIHDRVELTLFAIREGLVKEQGGGT